jgi:hypothetical protein
MQYYCRVYLRFKSTCNKVQPLVMQRLQQSKKLKTPSDDQKHGLSHRNVGRSSSKKRHQDVKKRRASGSISTESSSGKTTAKELSIRDSGSSVPGKKKKRHSHSSLTKEFKKAKPPTFDGEIKKEEEVEAWLLGLRKYFRVHNYSKNTKAKISIFNLNGGASIWWEDLKEVKGLKENKLTWKQVEKHFRKAYLSEKYYDARLKNSMNIRWGNLPWMLMPGDS